MRTSGSCLVKTDFRTDVTTWLGVNVTIRRRSQASSEVSFVAARALPLLHDNENGTFGPSPNALSHIKYLSPTSRDRQCLCGGARGDGDPWVWILRLDNPLQNDVTGGSICTNDSAD